MSTELLNAGEKSRHEWEEYLVTGQRDSAGAILEYAKRVTEFKLKCDKSQGGSTFAVDVKKWLGLSGASASQLVTIGTALPKLFVITKSLPPVEKTIYDLAMLTKADDKTKVDTFQAAVDADIIHPDMKAKEVKAFKDGLIEDAKTPAQKKKEEKAAAIKKDEDARKAQSLADEIKDQNEAPDMTQEQFMQIVSGYLPAKWLSILDDYDGTIPDIQRMMYFKNRKAVLASLSRFSKADDKKLMSALAEIINAQSIAFDELMKDKPKYHKIAEDQLKKATIDMKEKTASLTADNAVTPSGTLTTQEFKLIRSLLHPDKGQRETKAFNAFSRVFS